MSLVSPDGLTIVFSSSRPAPLAAGATDIWMSTRSAKNGVFAEPTLLVEANSSATERPSLISPDGCVLYFARDVGSGAADIYTLERAK